MDRLKVGVLISGRGSNMTALAKACAATDFPAEIVLVLSNGADPGGLERAEGLGIATELISHHDFPNRSSFEIALTERLEAAGVEFICLAGFMRLLTASFVNHWRDRMINIHPSLLPAFKGLHTHERALKAGVRISGCTVHFVRPEMDEGPIIIQAAVPVLADDTPNSLASRILVQEHRIYPEALRLIASGAATVMGERMRFRAAVGNDNLLVNPVPAQP
ncbi:MAG: phosphoribosylglycinamide formyltransferase [Rhodospirillaceae bacterium]|nr:phosphoribosylglycinamide formyltransferase [Rhodospirillaceae bacterium]